MNIANEMAACVKKMGGVVLDEVLHQPDFSNADYWFPEYRVIVELKSLTKDLSADPEFEHRVRELYKSWVQRELVAPLVEPSQMVSLQALPPQCAAEFLSMLKRKLETSTIRKANRQIRETKNYLSAPDAVGHLLLANDGNLMLTPAVATHLLSKLLRIEHSSIRSLTFFSASEILQVPGVPVPAAFWIDAVVSDREPAPLSFRRALRDAWQAHLSSLVPGPSFEYVLPAEQSVLQDMEFVRRAGT